MIWRLPTFFSISSLAVLNMFYGSLLAGTVSGHVSVVQSGHSAGRRSSDYSGVVVWLTFNDTVGLDPVRKHVEMRQKDKKFTPHILAVETGTSVDLPNLDPIFHNAFSNFNGQIFDVALYPPGSSKSVRFDRSGIVRIFCNIHPSMSAIIVVVDSSYYAVTKSDGSFYIPDVRSGTYELNVFYERSTPETLEALTRRITVDSEALELPDISVSEAGYLPVAHKNKYGRDYPVNSDQAGYSLPLK